ncbi:MAG TPA: response regulator transcription factor [Coriobacteriia bacterium]|nr:response regulator transcription factor [Coriobacteriia bacterium]
MHMKRVLIAADDVHTRAWARSALEPLDVTITECAASDLPTAAAAGEPELLVVDGGRDPDATVRVCEREASRGSEARVLLMIEPSALGVLRMPSRMRADFFVRGASSEEFGGRVRALLWPGEEARSQELVRVDQLTVNLATYQAHLDGSPIDFTYLEYALFAFLITHPNRAYSREVLLRRVWDADYYGGVRTVDVHVRRVRAKLGPELGKRLETVRNVGYLWNG